MGLSPMSDETLMAAFSTGDVVSGEELANRYAGKLCGFFRKTGRDLGQAEDLAQDTLMRMVRSRGDYHQGAPFRPWLYTIAHNLLRDEIRKDGRASARADNLPLGAGMTQEASMDLLEAREAKAAIQEAVNLLSEDLRAVVILKHFEGLSSPEIASVLGIPVGTVWSRMANATGCLRQTLIERGVNP